MRKTTKDLENNVIWFKEFLEEQKEILSPEEYKSVEHAAVDNFHLYKSREEALKSLRQIARLFVKLLREFNPLKK